MALVACGAAASLIKVTRGDLPATNQRRTFVRVEVVMKMQMSSFVQRLVDAYNKRTLDEFDALLTDDVVLVRDEEKAHGREEFKAVLDRLQRAFPDIQYRIDETIVAGDRIVLRWQARGTHRGE